MLGLLLAIIGGMVGAVLVDNIANTIEEKANEKLK